MNTFDWKCYACKNSILSGEGAVQADLNFAAAGTAGRNFQWFHSRCSPFASMFGPTSDEVSQLRAQVQTLTAQLAEAEARGMRRATDCLDAMIQTFDKRLSGLNGVERLGVEMGRDSLLAAKLVIERTKP